jgi:hypothetical protein
MTLRRVVLTLVLVGASVWCTGLVVKAYSERERATHPPNASAPGEVPPAR